MRLFVFPALNLKSCIISAGLCYVLKHEQNRYREVDQSCKGPGAPLGCERLNAQMLQMFLAPSSSVTQIMFDTCYTEMHVSLHSANLSN